MPVHIVGESRLLRDMFLAICQSNDYQIGTCCDELSTLAGLGIDDLVLYYSHETGPELVEELRQFKEGNDASLLILIMGRECSTSMQTALSAYAEAVIPQRKSAEALIAALRVKRSAAHSTAHSTERPTRPRQRRRWQNTRGRTCAGCRPRLRPAVFRGANG
ncbi:putative regulatory protein, LuxR family (plasmid) [Phaeobacter piscinae]|nr:putative regulatory protein, LuxR family [Phaeobacter piscinae]